jgi:hypothetical protein
MRINYEYMQYTYICVMTYALLCPVILEHHVLKIVQFHAR